MHFIQFFWLIVFLTKNSALGEGCFFDYAKDFPQFSPLIFKPQVDGLVLSEAKSAEGLAGFAVEKDKNVLLSCAGPGNNFQGDSKLQTLEVDCRGKNVLAIGRKTYNFAELTCKYRVRGEVLNKGTQCAKRRGRLLQIGFNITTGPLDNYWYPLIDVCFNAKESITYYSTHVLIGKGLLAVQPMNSRPIFQPGPRELYPDFHPNDYYKQSYQKPLLTRLLGSEEKADEILNITYLARGHLSPDGDFFYEGTSFATYFYVNVAPQWQSMNGGVWLTLEKAVRDLALSTLVDYNIYTGTFGVLTLPDINNNEQEIYLYDDTELPVPKFFWKIVEEPSSKKGIAFVGLNSPLETADIKWPCKDICSSYEWGFPSWNNSLICCTVKSFRRAVSTSPDVVVDDKVGVLEGPNSPLAKAVRRMRTNSLQGTTMGSPAPRRNSI